MTMLRQIEHFADRSAALPTESLNVVLQKVNQQELIRTYLWPSHPTEM